jgi:hypothetical protein
MLIIAPGPENPANFQRITPVSAIIFLVAKERVKDAKRSLANALLASTSTPFFSLDISSYFSPGEFLEILDMDDEFIAQDLCLIRSMLFCVGLEVVQELCKMEK